MPAPDPLARLKSEAAAEVQQIYADLAARPLERNCSLRTECCQFHLTGKIPQLTRGEALVAAKALRATGRKTLPDPTYGTRPLLDPKTSRCLIYKSRPFGCRTHFCAASGPHPINQALAAILVRFWRVSARAAIHDRLKITPRGGVDPLPPRW